MFPKINSFECMNCWYNQVDFGWKSAFLVKNTQKWGKKWKISQIIKISLIWSAKWAHLGCVVSNMKFFFLKSFWNVFILIANHLLTSNFVAATKSYGEDGSGNNPANGCDGGSGCDEETQLLISKHILYKWVFLGNLRLLDSKKLKKIFLIKSWGCRVENAYQNTKVDKSKPNEKENFFWTKFWI